ncbi:MAG: hypothetical protein NTX50_21560 [Candidatus Sumerlaeota bacterium]|nr:hypothetical protein [Candidatus Sumerlaeota bacterium]
MSIGTTHKVSKNEHVGMQSDSQGAPEGQKEPAEASFWRHQTIEELAAKQRVNPVTDLKLLQGTWPGEDDDGFEEWIEELRASQIIGGGAASHG